MRILAALLIAAPFVARGAASSPVTFNRQIAPIIYQNCSSCHRPGEAAPFSLLSYENVAKKGKTIAIVPMLEQLHERREVLLKKIIESSDNLQRIVDPVSRQPFAEKTQVAAAPVPTRSAAGG